MPAWQARGLGVPRPRARREPLATSRPASSTAERARVATTRRRTGRCRSATAGSTSPEALHPDEDVDRTTASAIYHRNFGAAKWQTTLAWGRNKPSHGEPTDTYLLESAVAFAKAHTFFGRVERADKNELFLPGDPRDHETFRVGKLTAGYVYDFVTDGHFRVGLGGLVSRYSLPAELHPDYGSSPTSFMIFARVKIQ